MSPKTEKVYLPVETVSSLTAYVYFKICILSFIYIYMNNMIFQRIKKIPSPVIPLKIYAWCMQDALARSEEKNKRSMRVTGDTCTRLHVCRLGLSSRFGCTPPEQIPDALPGPASAGRQRARRGARRHRR